MLMRQQFPNTIGNTLLILDPGFHVTALTPQQFPNTMQREHFNNLTVEPGFHIIALTPH